MENNRFADCREIFEEFDSSCGKHVTASDYLPLDETLYPMCAKANFKQFNPSKPSKYGKLFQPINASRYPFTFTTTVYAGKPKEDPTMYYTRGPEETVKFMIQTLKSQKDLQKRNLSNNHLYTSAALAEWLLTHGIISVAALKANQKGILREITTVLR